MKIIIKEEESEITISTDHLSNYNFVDFIIQQGEEEIGETISIEDLYTAVKAFYDKRNRELEHDKLMKN